MMWILGDECSYSSHMENSDFQHSDEDGNYEHDYTPTVILNPCGTSDRSMLNCFVIYVFFKLQFMNLFSKLYNLGSS